MKDMGRVVGIYTRSALPRPVSQAASLGLQEVTVQPWALSLNMPHTWKVATGVSPDLQQETTGTWLGKARGGSLFVQFHEPANLARVRIPVLLWKENGQCIHGMWTA